MKLNVFTLKQQTQDFILRLFVESASDAELYKYLFGRMYIKRYVFVTRYISLVSEFT